MPVESRLESGTATNPGMRVLAMPEYHYHPPLMLKGHVVVRSLDDAVRFITGYRQPRHPFMRERVLHQLEGAPGDLEERYAADAFLEWVRMEDLIEGD